MKSAEEGLQRMVKSLVTIRRSKGEAERAIREIQKRQEEERGERHARKR